MKLVKYLIFIIIGIGAMLIGWFLLFDGYVPPCRECECLAPRLDLKQVPTVPIFHSPYHYFLGCPITPEEYSSADWLEGNSDNVIRYYCKGHGKFFISDYIYKGDSLKIETSGAMWLYDSLLHDYEIYYYFNRPNLVEDTSRYARKILFEQGITILKDSFAIDLDTERYEKLDTTLFSYKLVMDTFNTRIKFKIYYKFTDSLKSGKFDKIN
jgi:hypothetical protein